MLRKKKNCFNISTELKKREKNTLASGLRTTGLCYLNVESRQSTIYYWVVWLIYVHNDKSLQRKSDSEQSSVEQVPDKLKLFELY